MALSNPHLRTNPGIFWPDLKTAYLHTVFDHLTKSIFSNVCVSTKIDNGSDLYHPVENIKEGTIKYFSFQKQNGDHWIKIRVSSKFEASKPYRDWLVKILQEKGVEMRVGSRMKMEVRLRSLLFEYRHLLKSDRALSKFNI